MKVHIERIVCLICGYELQRIEGSEIRRCCRCDYEVNVDLPDSFFEIDFPQGLKVFDGRTGKSFVVD